MSRIIQIEELEKIQSKEKIGSGKCANLYREGNDVYKIVKQDSDSKKLYGIENIEELTTIKSEICIFPKEILIDNENSFVGYIMDYVPGTKLKNIFSKIPLKQMREIINKAETEIEDLSQQKIIFDDMHYDNMMWDASDNCIKIIDTDFFKFGDDIPTEEVKKGNLSKFNKEMEIVIGLKDYTLNKYLSRNKEYIDFYKEWNNRYENAEKLNVCDLIDKIKQIAEKDFGIEFNSISEIAEKAKSKVKEYEDYDLDIEHWSEGNDHLKNLLINCRDNDIPSMYSCAGHGKSKPAYITVEMNEKTIGKIYNIINQISYIKDIGFRFAQKEFGKNPNFTIYMNKEKNKDEIMDIISQSLTKEKLDKELPYNFKMITQIVDVFQKRDIGFDLVYEIGKKSNNLLVENLKFANSKYMDDSDFYKMGLKLKRDMFDNKKYLKKGIKEGKSEQHVLGNILGYLSKTYDIDVEMSNELSAEQQNEKKKWSSKLLNKVPFLNKFVKSKFKMLPEPDSQRNNTSLKEQKDEFFRRLSNNGEYRGLSNNGIKKENQYHMDIANNNDDKDIEL